MPRATINLLLAGSCGFVTSCLPKKVPGTLPLVTEHRLDRFEVEHDNFRLRPIISSTSGDGLWPLSRCRLNACGETREHLSEVMTLSPVLPRLEGARAIR